MNRLEKAEEMAVAVGITCLVLGWFLGVWACWSAKPFREYIIERTVYVEEEYPYNVSKRKPEEKTQYFRDGKEVPYEEYTK